jgi:Na+-driven multidrug efflux pump
MIGWSVVAGTLFGVVLLALADLIPRAFTSDDAVLEHASEIWPLFALMMPANGAVFALDGILIGAGDTRFLMWGMLAAAAVYIPVALLALAQDWGIEGVWFGLAGLIAVRLLTCGTRFMGSRWALTGAPVPG